MTTIRIEILSHFIITTLCAVLVFHSLDIRMGYAIYIQSNDTPGTTTPTTTTSPSLAKMLVDNAIQEFQNNDINNTITYLTGAEQELSSLTLDGNGSIAHHISIQPLTILLFVKTATQSIDNHDFRKARIYLNLADQELGISMLDTSNSKTKATATTNAALNKNYLTYTNNKYGIQLQYPHNWVVEADDYTTGAGGMQIASFYLPDTNKGLPFFRIGVDNVSKEFPNLQKISINQYLQRSLAHKNSTGFPGFNLIESNTNNRLAGNLAYAIAWTYTHQTYGSRKSLEIATVIGGKGYFVDYTAATANFSNYLPNAQNMTKSFEIIRSG
ncbi:MAG TPA: hypothetical protein VI278_03395 [Nitrososphaeraceae archaeon]